MSTKRKTSILLIYTGGTIGMIKDPQTGALKPFDFKQLTKQVPELIKLDLQLDTHSFKQPMDSSNMSPAIWIYLTEIIKENYARYDGFVILHGSDTMAYTASALSFMLENLNKPVILTGSQLPIGTIRTDGKENLITAIEIAAARINGKPVVPEVAIYFEYSLYRGNRTHKFNAEHFNAFSSANYPVLATAGVNIDYNFSVIQKPGNQKLQVHQQLDTNITILKLFPGISEHVVRAILSTKGVKAVILETFGSGNASTQPWFIGLLEEAIERGIIILNITQCNRGSVRQGNYETSTALKRIGVTGGADMTTEAAVTKLMYLMGATSDLKKVTKLLETNLRGELTN